VLALQGPLSRTWPIEPDVPAAVLQALRSSEFAGTRDRGELALRYCQTYNPAFDVAPAENITALITEKGIIQPVTTENVKKVLG